MIKRMRFWIIVGWLLSQAVFALEVRGLYEVEVVAQSQAVGDRDKAIQAGLRIVLGRILVEPDLWLDDNAQLLLAKAKDYVREYQFALTGVAGASEAPARVLRILFDEQKLQALLRSSKLGLWNEIRPETLLWMVVEEQGKRLFFNPEKMSQLNIALRHASKLQGVPILLPLMDIEEQSMLSVAEVLSPYPHPLLDISERYEAVSILVGLIVSRNGCWQTEWAHYFDQRIQQWQGACKPLNQALLDGLRGTYLNLAAFYGVKPELPNKLPVPLKLH